MVVLNLQLNKTSNNLPIVETLLYNNSSRTSTKYWKERRYGMTQNQLEYRKSWETARHNQQDENLRQQELSETQRHNLAGEALGEKQIAVTISENAKDRKNKIQTTRMNNKSQQKVADKQLKGTKYAANKSYQATKYAADKGYKGTKYSADKHKEGVVQSAIINSDTQKYVADKSFKANMSKIKLDKEIAFDSPSAMKDLATVEKLHNDMVIDTENLKRITLDSESMRKVNNTQSQYNKAATALANGNTKKAEAETKALEKQVKNADRELATKEKQAEAAVSQAKTAKDKQAAEERLGNIRTTREWYSSILDTSKYIRNILNPQSQMSAGDASSLAKLLMSGGI